jgi:decaprenyl-phosphate phosphoribosyltransferase
MKDSRASQPIDPTPPQVVPAMSETGDVTIEAAVPATPLLLIRAMRPRQWMKNSLVVAAPLAAGRLDEREILFTTLVAVVCFCAASSSVYLFNDVADREADRLHPRKQHRPIAAGLVSPALALGTAAGLAAASIVVAFVIDAQFGALVVAYLALQAAYALGLKHQPVLDIAVIAGGFLMRAVGGGLATDIGLSDWFLMVAGFGSLFMVAGKRYSELLALGGDSFTRRSLAGYTETYLRFIWSAAAGVTITGYCLWAFSLPNDGGVAWEAISIIPFVLGILRYAIDIDAGEAGEPEDIVLRDRVLQLIGLAWLCCVTIGVFSG